MYACVMENQVVLIKTVFLCRTSQLINVSVEMYEKVGENIRSPGNNIMLLFNHRILLIA